LPQGRRPVGAHEAVGQSARPDAIDERRVGAQDVEGRRVAPGVEEGRLVVAQDEHEAAVRRLVDQVGAEHVQVVGDVPQVAPGHWLVVDARRRD
jgi:hypothetical protein